mgnify:CR=1 FL=1
MDRFTILTKESEKQQGMASGEEFLIQGDVLGRAKAPDDHLKETPPLLFLGCESRSKEPGITTFQQVAVIRSFSNL